MIYRNITTCPRRNVSSPMLVVCIFRGLTKFLRLCSRLEIVKPKRQKRKEKGCRMYTFSWGWLLEVKFKRERERERECVCVLSLWVEMERVCCLCKSQWREWERECVLSLYVKMWKRESVCCCKTRVYIDNPCHAVGSKCAEQNQSCRHSCEY